MQEDCEKQEDLCIAIHVEQKLPMESLIVLNVVLIYIKHAILKNMIVIPPD